MHVPRICESVTGQTMADLLNGRNASEADLVELRLDGVADLDVPALLAGRTLPVILTCRPTWEGGRFQGSETDRLRILSHGLDAGADFIDVEFHARAESLIACAPERVIVSMHDFGGVPGDLASRVREMRGTGAGLIKVAVMATCLSDLIPLLAIGQPGDALVIGMGAAGLLTRLLPERFGSPWSYGGSGVAPGQVPVHRMRQEYGFGAHSANAQVYGVVGNRAAHSLSPAMHNAALAQATIDAVYVPFVTESFGDFLAVADTLGVAGASVTVPFKRAALAAAGRADDEARVIGAANTIRADDGGWEATNTDAGGMLDAIGPIFGDALRDARVAVLGAGGVARAAIVALSRAGARVTVHARRESEAARLATEFGLAAGPWPPPAESWDAVVNATPIGSAANPTELPIPAEWLNGQMIYDLTYHTAESPLITAARAAHCTVLDGLPMLIAQAERQFVWWHGRRPQAGVMAAAAARARHDIRADEQGAG